MLKTGELAARGAFPDACRLVSAGSGQPFAIGADDDSLNAILVLIESWQSALILTIMVDLGRPNETCENIINRVLMRKLFAVCLTITLLSTFAYAKKFPMTAATIVPGARGDAEVGKDKNGNTKLKMKVEFLASPDSLTPPASVYIVWLQERGGNPENQGQLKVDKKLKASFETVTPLRNFDLSVTAEQDVGAKVPSGREVLKATIQR